jgi:hypothetical protein
MEDAAHSYDVELARYGSLLQIVKDTQEKLLDRLSFFYFTIDTVFLGPEGAKGVWRWMEGGLKKLLDLTFEVSLETSPHRFHRLVLVPYPESITNNYRRREFRRAVRTLLHYHMWHGVVCYVVFVHRERYSSEKWLRLIDFGSIGTRVVFDTSDYYSDGFSGLRVVEGTEADLHITRCFQILDKQDLESSLQLYYDELTFGHLRRKDAQWERLREFSFLLDGNRCPGPECAEILTRTSARLDHIDPLGRSNNVLLNLRLLCERCNKNKATLNTHELPFESAFSTVPLDLASKEVRAVLSDEAPQWLLRYQKPPENALRRLGV